MKSGGLSSRVRIVGFRGMLSLLMLLLAIEVGAVIVTGKRVRSAARRIERLTAERRSLDASAPSPNQPNADLILEDLADADMVRSKLAAQLSSPDVELEMRGTRSPMQRSDAFFQIAQFVEKMRESAMRRGIQVKGDEQFGFGAYAHDAPRLSEIAEIMRRRRALESVLNALFDARPIELLSVQCETAVNLARQAGTPRTGASDPKNVFTVDPRLSVRVAGAVDGCGFKIRFTGSTQVLRNFLNALAVHERPLVVRSVEVESVAGDSSQGAAKRAGPAAITGIPVSRFDVVVEAIEIDRLVRRTG
jgi:hypothetical protein